MDEDLKKIIGEEPETTPSEEEIPEEKDQEVKKEEEHLTNLKKAISEAEEDLKKLRKDKKQAKVIDEDEDIPQINLEDPAAKAWNKRINDTVAPVAEEAEKAKEEVRTFALRQFIKDHPDLATDREKLTALMGTYDRIKTASERTSEGVLVDLARAYAAENYESLEEQARQAQILKAQGDLMFSEPAITRGSTAYSSEREIAPKMTSDDAAQLAKWGMTPKEWIDMKKKYG